MLFPRRLARAVERQWTASLATAASVDVREQQDGYMVRLNLPQRDLEKVGVSLESGVLKVTAPAEERRRITNRLFHSQSGS